MSEQITKLEFLRAMFFSAEAEMPTRERTPDDLEALQAIVHGFEALKVCDVNVMIAALNYVEDRYGKPIRRCRLSCCR